MTGEISTEEWAINDWWAEHPSKAEYPDSFLVDYVRVYEIGEYQYPAGIHSASTSDHYKLFPNPASDQIMIHWDPMQYEGLPDISIVNLSGQIEKSFSSVQNNTQLFLDGLSRGIYCLSIRHDDAVEYMKFIKN